jgi:quercetin dioxygenase-like cupin family protein
MSDWKPDDSAIEGRPAAEKIRAALAKHHIETKNRVLTSRDDSMDEVRNELRRGDMPPGIRSWTLPVLPEGGAFVFLTVAEPGAVVPEHTHKRDLFRVVLSGSIITEGKELKTGDWMFVPKGTPYSYSAAFNPGAIILHFYD